MNTDKKPVAYPVVHLFYFSPYCLVYALILQIQQAQRQVHEHGFVVFLNF